MSYLHLLIFTAKNQLKAILLINNQHETVYIDTNGKNLIKII